LADVIRTVGGRATFDLDQPSGRAGLAHLVETGQVDSVQTREFDFHAAFLKLTGTAFE
jgi:ABC-2 type transport system ATP-binding protein